MCSREGKLRHESECHTEYEAEPISSQIQHLSCCLWIPHSLLWHTVKSLISAKYQKSWKPLYTSSLKTIHHKALETVQKYLMMRYPLSLQRLPGCFLDYVCHRWNAAASGAESNGQPTLHPGEGFGQKPVFMRSVSETSEFIVGHKNPTAWHAASCTELS